MGECIIKIYFKEIRKIIKMHLGLVILLCLLPVIIKCSFLEGTAGYAALYILIGISIISMILFIYQETKPLFMTFRLWYKEYRIAKRKKYIKDIKKIGIDYYNFHFDKEFLIYSDICCYRISFKKKLILKDIYEKQERPNSYLRWKEDIEYKYKNYPRKALIQFDRYLVLLGRDYENEIATNSLTLPIFITVLISQFFYDFLRSFQEKISPLLKDAELVWSLITFVILLVFAIAVAYGIAISLIYKKYGSATFHERLYRNH